MKSFLEYIMLNYTWFLGGAIIILLAIIGSYADKTNFGQGKDNNRQKEEDFVDDTNIEIENPIENINESVIEEEPKILNKEDTEINTIIDEPILEPVEETPEIENNVLEKLDEKFEIFDKEFNEFLPEKEIINDDLLDEIENLSLDKTQKLSLSDIPDLDDVELPRIKNLKSQDEDIWKF